MKIEDNSFLLNRTREYLSPILRYAYGATFRAKLDGLYKLALGVGDKYYDTITYPAIFILVKRTVYPHRFKTFMNYIKNQEYYITDYPFDDIQRGNKHMFVVRIPEKYLDAYQGFIKGQYSTMYSPVELSKFYDSEQRVYHVLHRTPKGYDHFLRTLKSMYGDNIRITKNDLIGAQLDLPIDETQEYFNT